MNIDNEKIMLMWDKYNNCYREVVDIKDIKGGIQMKPKKYEEVEYKTNRLCSDYKRDIRVLTIIIFIVAALGIYACFRGLSIATECEALKIENNELVKANEIKDSIISDLQEDNRELQKLIDGGNV